MAHICAPLASAAQRHSHPTTSCCDGRTRSAQELHDRVARLSAALSQALSVQPGDRVALLGPGTDVFFEALLAVADCGAIACPVNTRWSVAEAAAALALVQPKALLVDLNAGGLARSISALQSAAAGIVVVQLGSGQPPPAQAAMDGRRLLSTEQLMQQQAQKAGMPQLQLLQPADGTALIVFTSGTTGAPKGAALNHAALMHQSLVKLALVGYCAEDVYLHIAPLFHVGGISSALAVLMAGGSHVFAPKYSPAAVVQLVQRHNVTAMIAVPAMIEDVAKLLEGSAGGASSSNSSRSGGGNGAACLPSVQRLLVGAGGMSEALQAAAARTFPNATIMTAYGMTEAASSITFLTLRPAPKPQRQLPHSHHPASEDGAGVLRGGVCVGWPAPGVQVRIEATVDADTANAAAAMSSMGRVGGRDSTASMSAFGGGGVAGSSGAGSGVGEVQIRGPNVMSRYWAADEATSSAFAPGGWLRTGDMGRLDAVGRLWLVGRKKDMIKSGGENVHAAEVEAVLASHPGVAAAAVLGLPHVRLGEMVAAVVVLKQGWQWRGEPSALLPAASAGAGPAASSTPHNSTDAAAPIICKALAQNLLDAQQLREHCRSAQLTAYKLPRAVAIRAELPRNASGKVVKRVLQQELIQAMGQEQASTTLLGAEHAGHAAALDAQPRSKL